LELENVIGESPVRRVVRSTRGVQQRSPTQEKKNVGKGGEKKPRFFSTKGQACRTHGYDESLGGGREQAGRKVFNGARRCKKGRRKKKKGGGGRVLPAEGRPPGARRQTGGGKK